MNAPTRFQKQLVTARPVWGSPEWHAEMQRQARAIFINGDRFAGRDFDREQEVTSGDDYVVTTRQSGDGL